MMTATAMRSSEESNATIHAPCQGGGDADSERDGGGKAPPRPASLELDAGPAAGGVIGTNRDGVGSGWRPVAATSRDELLTSTSGAASSGSADGCAPRPGPRVFSHAGRSSSLRKVRGSMTESSASGSSAAASGSGAVTSRSDSVLHAGGRRSQSGIESVSPPSGIGGKLVLSSRSAMQSSSRVAANGGRAGATQNCVSPAGVEPGRQNQAKASRGRR